MGEVPQTTKALTLKEMFPDDTVFNSLMEQFDIYQSTGDGRGIVQIAKDNKEALEKQEVNINFLPFYLMKRLVERAMEEAEKKMSAQREADAMVNNFVEQEIEKNGGIINSDAAEKEEENEKTDTETTTTEATANSDGNRECGYEEASESESG